MSNDARPAPTTEQYRLDLDETRRRLDTGELYVDFGPGLEDLEEERVRGKELTERYNATTIRDPEARTAVARELFRSFGEGSWIETPIYCAYGSHTSIGDGCWFNTGATFIDDAEIVIGSGVLLGPHVTISTAGHPLDPDLRLTGAQFSATVTIGDRAWLGANVTVLPGVSIGEGAVVAAGAVVTRNVPPMTVVGGVPARVLRRIAPGEETAFRPPQDMS
ncbi:MULTISPECIES: sugar O-acetyltransferase [unclassified Actinomyces]|uniref:sugar O-acetyltransferase n=1 Tax=unclassified Actinomyces TaxID=2609248 RepID=UPI0020176395|nr:MULTISPECIES: sugar O-acetyltransferase [unclassified Actinomyces]MCL3777272.1 sugar O-acetyltransferase [Actinomyces sp. AC-20-1]MCL3789916.1 sugar O-acetyltransferase [Actinomyces sp. 187325]MCL3792132.1 sugar O-acetyltransferase [Actinomyces sp. 186855]MCL3793634.1 sugar O-acetyltransferase [Actinomyces sp. 217892]